MVDKKIEIGIDIQELGKGALKAVTKDMRYEKCLSWNF